MIDRTNTEEATPATQHTQPVKSSSERWLLRLLGEPLLHFLLLGLVLFALHARFRSDRDGLGGEQQIAVSAGKVDHLAVLFARTWQRPPTRQELEGLVNDYIREEAAYREGVALGLDRNDTIIRRRIRQKLDFVAEDLSSQIDPTEEELEQYLQEHEEDFRIDPQLSFRQVYFDPEQHDDSLDAMVADLVATLRDDPSIRAEEQGDRTLLEFRYSNVSPREVANMFGERFAGEIVSLERGAWHGPIRSAYGVHAVLVDERRPGRRVRLDEVRDAVRREWEHVRRQQLTKEYYESLLEKYEVVVQWPEAAAEEK